MNPSLRFASVLLLTLVSFSCTRLDDGMVRGRKAVSTLLDSVELVMDDNPSYADTIIQKIDSHSIKNKGQRARYALLYTSTQYKNYRTISTDSIIMEAVNYYSVHNNLDYRFLSYYFLGCVYIDLGRWTEASVALAQAEQMADKIDNDFWKGLLYCRLGYIYWESFNYHCAKDYFGKAVHYYERSGKESHRIYSLCYSAKCDIHMQKYNRADSVLCKNQNIAFEKANSVTFDLLIVSRFYCNLLMHEIDSLTLLYDNYLSKYQESTNSFFLVLQAWYYCQLNDYTESDLKMEMAKQCAHSITDSVYCYFYSAKIQENKGDIEKALYYYKQYKNLDNKLCVEKLMAPVFDAQKTFFQNVAELESVKARNRKIILVLSVLLFTLIVSILLFVSLKRKSDTDRQKKDLLLTISDLTTQISVKKDELSNLNDKVREMLRQQFNQSDYIYTRYYEQIDDNKKAERIYRVVKSQLDGFTNSKNIAHIDELLDESFDGIMSKVLSSALEIKEKDLLILRFALAGFSAKSIAALLDDTHQNITQRKKRMLDKIQLKAPNLMEELRISLNIK